MAFSITTATKKIAKMRKRIRAVPGGTSAGKTIAILSVLIDKAQRDQTPTLTSVVSESFPHLKRGVIKDFIDILTTQEYFKDKNWNKTDYTYTFETGSKIEFFSADQPGKTRGPRRHRLFINEANNIPFETFEQLEIRTSEFVFLDWNPVGEFWYYTDVKGREDAEELTLTYKDNEGLSPEIVGAIESRKHRANWWRVYGEGQLGELEDIIYHDWKLIDDIPHEARLVRRWLDFGYTLDPTAIGDVYYYNGGYILDEQLYQKQMLNKPIADFLLNLPEPNTIVVADSAEPKSIDELKLYGVNVIPAVKGPDSVRNGIAVVQSQRISVTKRSINLLREYRNYVYQKDRLGNTIPEPVDFNNHHLDGIRYAMASLVGEIPPDEEIRRMRRNAENRRSLLHSVGVDAGL